MTDVLAITATAVSIAIGLAGVLCAIMYAILWGVWFVGPKPRGSFKEHVATAFGMRIYEFPTVASPWVACKPPEPILPEQEPRKPYSTAERKARGVRARIQREEIENALDRMILRASKAWAESSPDETAKREESYRLVNVIHALRKELRSVESDGEMAAREETLRPADN